MSFDMRRETFPTIEIGDGFCSIDFRVGGFEFGQIVDLDNHGDIVAEILNRLGHDVERTMPWISEGVRARAELKAFYLELTSDRSQLVYDLRGNHPIEFLYQEMTRYHSQKAARVAKRNSIRRRRNTFNVHRDDLVLALLDAGVPYVCAHPKCNANSDLTVDHVLALSRGGSDDIENLQFLCISHNSEKGDRETPANWAAEG